MDRQNEQKLTIQPDFGRDILDKPFLTIGEVASLLQVSSRTVYNLIYSGTLRACRITYHITLITKEDFFLMIKETTYCKRSVSVFAKQGKKTKGKMKKDVQKTEETALTRQEGKTKAKGSSAKRRLIPTANYKQSVRDTFTDSESVAGDLYTMAEICQKFNYTYGRFYNLRMRYSIPCIKANATKCFPKAEVDKAMAEEAEQPFGALVLVFRHHAPVRTGQDTGAQVRPHPRGTDKAHTRQPPVLPESRLGCGTEGSRAEKRKHESQTGRIRYFQTFKIHYPYDEHLYESDGQETTHQERTVIALSRLLPTCPAPENGQADTEGVPRHLYLRQSDREV